MFYKCLKWLLVASLLMSVNAYSAEDGGEGEDFPFKCAPNAGSLDNQNLIVWASTKSTTGYYAILGESHSKHTPRFEVEVIGKDLDHYFVRGFWKAEVFAGAIIAKVNLATGESNLKYGEWRRRTSHPRRVMHGRPWNEVVCTVRSSKP